jgi:hypothetical protein
MENRLTPSIMPLTITSASIRRPTIPFLFRGLAAKNNSGRHYSLATFLALVCLLLSADIAPAQDKTFNKPRYNNDRLDWCLTWAANCGKPAAVTFCNRRRFTDALVFRAEVVGKSAQTRLLGSNEVCNGHDFCTAFAYITCTGEIESHRVFTNP